MRRLWGLGLLLAACSTPPVQTAADRASTPVATTLSGQVIYQGSVRGDVIVFLYDAARPPPPVGTGHPLAFAQIPAAQAFGEALRDPTQVGPFASDYAFPLVAPGTYLVAAMLDGDTCYTDPVSGCRLSDFDPFFGVTAEPNGADQPGGHVDASGALAPVLVPPADTSGVVPAVDEVQVAVGQAVGDRPAFTVIAASAAVSTSTPTPFSLQADPILSPPIDERNAAFLLAYVDDDHDGKPDLDQNGIPLLWPRVLLRKVADPNPANPQPSDPLAALGLLDENDLNNDGQLDATGVSYPHLVNNLVVPASGSPSLALIPTAYLAIPPPANPAQGLVPTQLFAQLADAQGNPDVTKVVPLTHLELAALPLAVDAANPAQPVPLASMPTGRYAVIVEQLTGQTWRVPDELEPLYAAQVGLPPQPGQDFAFTVGP